MQTLFFKETLLLEMDQVKLVQIYAQKLTLLTKKQRVIFDLLSSGMLVKDIAKHLELAEITVKVVKARVMVIIGVTNLQQMAVISKCAVYPTPSRNLWQYRRCNLLLFISLGLIHIHHITKGSHLDVRVIDQSCI